MPTNPWNLTNERVCREAMASLVATDALEEKPPRLTTASRSRYKSKTKIKTRDGDTAIVYEYGPRQVANRNKDKAVRVENLRKNLTDLRARVRKDLKSEDDKTRMVALAVALIDETYERVGNEGSSKNGHFGVTGWQAKHFKTSGGKLSVHYVGKSGVSHTKEITRPASVKVVRDLLKGKSGTDCLFTTEEGTKVGAPDVNNYLTEFDITAKDLRGMHANQEMLARLKAVRSKGPALSKDRKERDKVLKEEFKKALEEAAEAVGHEAATLRTNYLVPGLEDAYMKDGTILKTLDQGVKKSSALRVASLYLSVARVARIATKTEEERLDDAASELIRPEPKTKPPRKDLRKNRIDTGDDPDIKQDSNATDKDMSLNYKKVAISIAATVLFREARPKPKPKKPSPNPAGSPGAESALAKYIKGKKFINPKSRQEVLYDSLPKEEKRRIRSRFMEEYAKQVKEQGAGGKEPKPKPKTTKKKEPAQVEPEVAPAKEEPADPQVVVDAFEKFKGMDADKRTQTLKKLRAREQQVKPGSEEAVALRKEIKAGEAAELADKPPETGETPAKGVLRKLYQKLFVNEHAQKPLLKVLESTTDGTALGFDSLEGFRSLHSDLDDGQFQEVFAATGDTGNPIFQAFSTGAFSNGEEVSSKQRKQLRKLLERNLEMVTLVTGPVQEYYGQPDSPEPGGAQAPATNTNNSNDGTPKKGPASSDIEAAVAAGESDNKVLDKAVVDASVATVPTTGDGAWGSPPRSSTKTEAKPEYPPPMSQEMISQYQTKGDPAVFNATVSPPLIVR